MEGKSNLLRRPGKNPDLALAQTAHPVLVPEAGPLPALEAALVLTALNPTTAPEVTPVQPVLLLCGPKKLLVLNQHLLHPQHSVHLALDPILALALAPVPVPVPAPRPLTAAIESEAEEVPSQQYVLSLVSLDSRKGGADSLHARSFTTQALIINEGYLTGELL